MDNIELEVQPRTARGRQLRRLRAQGVTPIHIYGKGMDPVAAQVDALLLRKTLVQAGRNTPITVRTPSDQHFTFVREIQKDPASGLILHADFFQVDRTQRMEGQIPIRFEGEAPAVKTHQGELMPNLRDIAVECLPTDMPHEFVVEVSGLEEIGDAIHVKDLVAPQGVAILNDPEEIVVRVNAPTKVEEAEEAEEGAAEGEEPAADEAKEEDAEEKE